MTGERPSGIVTFLFTDIEGSTRLWADDMTAMQTALARHDVLLRREFEQRRGYVFATGGDGFAVAFANPDDAIDAAIAVQNGLTEPAVVGEELRLRVRIGLHSGTAEERDGNYFGPALNAAARIMGSASGGQILASSIVVPLTHRADRMTPLGLVRLAGIVEPIEVCQVEAAQEPSRFPPLSTLDSVPNNLPRQRTAFVGREREVDTIVDELATWSLVTLTGVGGVGKTRLALQVADRALPDYPGGVWFVELASISDPADVGGALTRVIRPPMLPGSDPTSSLVAFLSSRNALLVIDNCEHVIDAIAEVVDAILAESDTVRILATSREGLGLEGERIRAIQPLPTGDRDSEGPAESLFKLRLAATDPDLELGPDQVDLVRSICSRLDGVPLALELAAARASTMGLAEILERLEERFQLLRGGRRAVAARHQTLRNTVEWSFELLDDDARALFPRLSVFSGAFQLDAVEALCAEAVDVDSVGNSLHALVSKSMVESVREPGRPRRYRLLETLRQFGSEQLQASDDARGWRDRHAELYGDLVVRLGAALHGPGEVAAWSRLLDEAPNLRSSVQWAAEAERPELAARLTGPTSLTLMWDQTLTSLAATALEVGAEADPQWGHGVLMGEIGYCYGVGDVARAEAACAALAALETGHPDLPAIAALGEGFVASLRGDFERGLAAFARGHELAVDAAEPTQLFCALVLSAFSAAHQRPERDAAAFGLALARRLETPTPLAFALASSSMIYEVSDPDRALALTEEALAIDIPPTGTSGMRHVMRGRVLFRRARWADALEALTTGIEALLQAGIAPEGSHCIAIGAACVHQLGHEELGRDLFRRSAACHGMQMIGMYREAEEQAAALIGEPYPPERTEPIDAFDVLARRAIRAFEDVLSSR